MLYGTIRKVRAGNEVGHIEQYVEYVEVSDEAAALSEYIKFIREAQTKHYQDPCIKLAMRTDGTLKRIIKEYSVAVDD